MIPAVKTNNIRVMDFERLYKCTNSDGIHSACLNAILKGLDFLFLFHNVFFRKECFNSKNENDYKHCVGIYQILKDYMMHLFPSRAPSLVTPELYCTIQNLFRYSFPSFGSINVKQLENKLELFDKCLRGLYERNVKYWDDNKPENFGQLIINRKYCTLDSKQILSSRR